MPVSSGYVRWIATAVVAALIVSATFVVYRPALRGEFIWDDNLYVRENSLVRSPDGLWDIWFDPMATPQYHPLVFSSYWLEYQRYGIGTFRYHVHNVALHAAAALLLWAVLAQLGVPGGALAAVLFALHPVHLESVAWIAERKNTLSAFFGFAAILAWVRFLDRRRWGWYAAALVLYACTLLSKSILCTLPAALLLLAWWKRPEDWRTLIGPLVPFVVLSVAIGYIGWWREQAYDPPGLPMSLFERLLIVNRALWFYLAKLVWPVELMVIYPRWDWQVSAWSLALLGATLGALTLLWVGRQRTGRGPLVAAGFFFVMLFPVLGVVDFNYTQHAFVADHFQYVPSAAPLALAAAAVSIAWRRQVPVLRLTGATLVAAAVVTLGWLSWNGAHTYSSAEVFWRAALAKNPNSWHAHSTFAGVLARRGRYEEAIRHYEQALTIRPDYAQAHNYWGVVLTMQGKYGAALAKYLDALQVDPTKADVHNNAGAVLARQGKWDEAAPYFEAAVRLNPQYFEAYDSWGIVALRQGKVDEAITHFESALRIKPDLESARIHLTQAQEIKRKREQAATGNPTPSPADAPRDGE